MVNILFYRIQKGGIPRPIGDTLLLFWSKYHVTQNNCQQFVWSMLLANQFPYELMNKEPFIQFNQKAEDLLGFFYFFNLMTLILSATFICNKKIPSDNCSLLITILFKLFWNLLDKLCSSLNGTSSTTFHKELVLNNSYL